MGEWKNIQKSGSRMRPYKIDKFSRDGREKKETKPQLGPI